MCTYIRMLHIYMYNFMISQCISTKVQVVKVGLLLRSLVINQGPLI